MSVAPFVATLTVSFRHGDSRRLVAGMRERPEIATLRVERTGRAAVYSIDVSAEDAHAAAAQAVAVANQVAVAAGAAQDTCVIAVDVDDDSDQFTGMRSALRMRLHGDAQGQIHLTDDVGARNQHARDPGQGDAATDRKG